jgi:hypothetical protein
MAGSQLEKMSASINKEMNGSRKGSGFRWE